MPPSGATKWTARSRLPDMMERGIDNELRLELYDPEQRVYASITSATVSLRLDGVDVFIDAAATIDGSAAVYTYAPPLTTGFTECGTIIWTADVDGEDVVLQREAWVVRHRLYCPIDTRDIYQRAPTLNPKHPATEVRCTGVVDDALLSAWEEIELLLIEQTRRPHVIVSPSAFRLAAIELTLAHAYGALKSRGGTSYVDQSKMHQDAFWKHWNRLRFREDTDQDQHTDTSSQTKATVWLL